ncbi:aminotransferase class I/II-fold pyridoxal phosphate-dependent enzyme [Shimia thalassica]|uniref:pyridoxal phosphate-dependent aminotransferase n=1 Tax=Shimia thalassica TaxID=1715693 RepID=UPI000C0770AF|nr:aminotransferase class I/II-fold pyridoxal phosphate-dependent enzyme [Shimia thalassica]MBU2944293.1 aminotransferase class I/II-fold pyridoxal phosphate-dependent enzyme [Shimia thalassica]MDO6504979.1 aminotransferase class I/II-fold pyridoxal phosphate-dependent enzyme [Shimia thalassica]PHO02730.1 1-aminocyclopropane-1-carboxylate deaminase [Rhodobacteraceae bacterium 4F10]
MRNSRRGMVDPFIVMDVMEAARQAEADGRHIIHMEVGQPGTAAPEGARRKLSEDMQSDAMGYTVALGIPELRARISKLYGEWYNVDLDPARVIVTPGSSGAFLLAFTALFNAGDKVAIGAPGYPSYRQILKALSLEPVDLQTSDANRLQPVPSDFAEMDVQGLMVASPANPTGTMLDKPAMSALIEACAAKGAAFISDEIYHGIEYEAKAVTALEITDECYVINSFSKYFSMTGWRVGWMVVPEDHVRMIERLAQNMFICAPHASQTVALAAMDCHEELQANMEVYKTNRNLMIEGLPKAGFTRFAPPDGAFYFYVDVRQFTNDSRAFAREILDEAGVAVTPGLDFDPVRGAGTLRFSYARSSADIAEGLERLKRFMVKRGFA